MAASVAFSSKASSLRGAALSFGSSSEVASLAEKILQRHENALAESDKERELKAAGSAAGQVEVHKSFSLHIGADLKIPTSTSRRAAHVSLSREEAERSAMHGNPFAGLPLQAWAERLGERVMPAYEVIKEEQRKSKMAAKRSPASAPTLPAIPHVLPFTYWAANSQSMRETLIAEDPKTRKRARLSWYHPDDTMVPRDWFKGGLLADLKYYSPFKSNPASKSVLE